MQLPRIEKLLNFLQGAEDTADGKRQTKYVAGVIDEFVRYSDAAEEMEKRLRELESFVSQRLHTVAQEAALFVSDHKEGEYEAYDKVLKKLKGR